MMRGNFCIFFIIQALQFEQYDMKLYTYNSVFERIERPREFPEIHRQNVKGVRLRDVDEGSRVVRKKVRHSNRR